MNELLNDRKKAALQNLDRMLGIQTHTKHEKITALREIEKAAKRMADGIERRFKEVE